MRFLTIDPGECSGWAVYDDGLKACGVTTRLNAGPIWNASYDFDLERVWIECPVIYPRSKARPNDVLKVSVSAGEWSGYLRPYGIETSYVTPAEWKGQLAKKVHHKRIRSLLTPTEREIVEAAESKLSPSKAHNMLDAVGLALWVAKRDGRS